MKTSKPFLMIAVMALVLILTSCAPGGGGYPSWGYGNRPEAQEAPSPLSEVYAERLAAPREQGEDAVSDEAFQQQAMITGHEFGEGTPTEGQQQAMGDAQLPPLPTTPVKVAILLPLSGEHAPLGEAMLKAAQMALFDVGHDGFELLPRDTKGTAEGATTAAQGALQDGAQLILGPVFADSVRAARSVVSSSNVSILGFSTDWTAAGGNAFVMGFLPFDQVERVTQYAAQQGIATTGVLAPNTPYGNAVANTYRSLAPRYGIMTEDVQLFDPASSNLSPIVRSFAKYDERAESLNQMIRPMKARLKISPKNGKLAEAIRTLEGMDTLGEIPFEAILLPVGGDQARALANIASHYDLLPSRVQRLGTGLWDDKGLAAEPGLDGAWFAAPAPGQRSEFESRYTNLYGKRPPRLTSLAYDATALAAVLARTGLRSKGAPAFDRASITNPNGFAGVDGIFRFRSDGLVERGLAVLKYQEGQIVVIDDAPVTFQRESRYY